MIISRRPPGYLRLFVKRVFDVFCSATILLVLSPLLLVAALAIRLESRGPIFFIEHKVCSNNRSVRVRKFRSRSHGAITVVGRFLLRSGVDRLPMLIDVLRGEMSIVGLHCHAAAPSSSSPERVPPELLISAFKPGLVSFERSNGDADCELRQIKADLFYMTHWSLQLDAKVLLRALLSRVAHAQSHRHL